MHIEKKTLRNIFLVAAGCIVLYWLLHEEERVMRLWNTVSGILSPFVAGAALAFVLNVPMRGIENLLKKIPKAGLRRALSIVLTLIGVLLLLYGIFALLIPQLGDTIESIAERLPVFFGNVQDKVMEIGRASCRERV